MLKTMFLTRLKLAVVGRCPPQLKHKLIRTLPCDALAASVRAILALSALFSFALGHKHRRERPSGLS
jgi:hypothetical protein